MGLFNYLTTPMGQQGMQNPMMQQFMPQQPGQPQMPGMTNSGIGSINPLTWAGLGILADTAHRGPTRGNWLGRSVGGAMQGIQMGQQLNRQQQAQQLEWAKLQATLGTNSLRSERLRMEIDESRRKRKAQEEAKGIFGNRPSIDASQRQDGPYMPGELPPGVEGTQGRGYLGGEFGREEAGARLAALGLPEYMGTANQLLKPEAPLKPLAGNKNGIWVPDPSSPTGYRHVPNPSSGVGGVGGAGWTPDTIRKEYNLADYTPESARQALETSNPDHLVPRGMYDPANVSLGDIRSQREEFQKSVETVRGGMHQLRNMQATLDKPGGLTDVATIYSFVKALDPGSVVREGEIAIVENSRGLINTLKGTMTKAQGRGFLTVPDRQQLDVISAQLASNYQKLYEGRRADFRQIAQPLMEANNLSELQALGSGVQFNLPRYEPPASAGNPAAPGMEPAKMSRLEELRAKKAAQRANSPIRGGR